MSLLIGDKCLQADVDIEIIATIQLFFTLRSFLKRVKKTCFPHQSQPKEILNASVALNIQ